jgi:hypothetical protein
MAKVRGRLEWRGLARPFSISMIVIIAFGFLTAWGKHDTFDRYWIAGFILEIENDEISNALWLSSLASRIQIQSSFRCKLLHGVCEY